MKNNYDEFERRNDVDGYESEEFDTSRNLNPSDAITVKRRKQVGNRN